MKVHPTGAFEFAGVTFGIMHFSENWELAEQRQDAKPDAGFPKRSAAGWDLNAKFNARGGAFALRQSIRKTGEDAFSYEANLASDAGVKSNALALCGVLPVDRYAGAQVQVDDKSIALPRELGEMSVYRRDGVKKLVLSSPAGMLVIEGSFSVYIQDDRKYNSPQFALRLGFAPSTGEIKQAALQLSMRQLPYESTPLDISAAANMAWADEVADDKKGGWTDQGPENDLRMIKLGAQHFGPMSFVILDPAKNGGKSCIVLAGPQREYFPKSARVSAEKAMPYLYLLHATAWTPSGKEIIGTIRATYADGTESRCEVSSARDVGNWWAPTPLSNGAVAWTAENKSAFVGLYLSRFDLQNKPLKSIEFESTGKAVWMIAAVNGAPAPVPLPTEGPTYIVESAQWRPIQHTLDIQPGGILDFSSMLDAPAGKYGNLVVKGPHFEFADRPGKPVRFYGTNLCFSSNYPGKADAEKIADRLARIGYNAVRLHHYDAELTDRSAKDSVTLDPRQLDRIQYFIHCLKQRGIYVIIDLYTIRETRANEIPEIGRPVRDGYKALVPLLDSAMANWQQFARNWLTHKNPYTGMTLAQDPVLIGICPLNEDPLAVCYNAAPDVRRLYDQRFENWLAQKKSPQTDAERKKLHSKFLNDIQIVGNEKTFAFLKGLGVKAPLTSVNCLDSMTLTAVRARLEYVDNHAYWDHPGFPEGAWSMPFSYGNKSAIAAAASARAA